MRVVRNGASAWVPACSSRTPVRGDGDSPPAVPAPGKPSVPAAGVTVSRRSREGGGAPAQGGGLGAALANPPPWAPSSAKKRMTKRGSGRTRTSVLSIHQAQPPDSSEREWWTEETETTDSNTKAAANEGLTHNLPLSPANKPAVVIQTSANGNRLTYAFRTAARRRHTTNTISGFRGNPVRGADLSELWGQLSEEHDSTVLSSTDAHPSHPPPSNLTAGTSLLLFKRNYKEEMGEAIAFHKKVTTGDQCSNRALAKFIISLTTIPFQRRTLRLQAEAKMNFYR
ncbi:hypothetical protein MG293_017321 [Ovis ammon polii]|uniref:Uncharacterized protein n=1 Tax=Ovis ammon polii TaxID=230172 RepID=A0AAD4TS23_OVIAM|nr:hypothetical protein MG293_017321 [Ovis ammon polii]